MYIDGEVSEKHRCWTLIGQADRLVLSPARLSLPRPAKLESCYCYTKDRFKTPHSASDHDLEATLIAR